MLKTGHLVPVTVIKALPDYDSYLMAIPGTEHIALLDRAHAGLHLRVGDHTVALVYYIKNGRIILTQKTDNFFRRLTEMLVSPLLMEDKVKVVKAAAIDGASFAKVAVASDNGYDPIAECLPYIKPESVKRFTNRTITLVRYSTDIEEYVSSAFAPALIDDVLEVTYIQEKDEEEEIHVRVEADRLARFIGKGGANIATVSKLVGIRVRVFSA